ncbi:MAG TPA: hypothetical protein VNU64_06815 [Burkholderiales bacterium]|nr:hypothetical protein [Burkholderiales bacterium]
MKDQEQRQKGRPHWPFDPLQPGDHEPVKLPEELERVQKQTGHGDPKEGRPRGDRA